jgi:hypothetical protein
MEFTILEVEVLKKAIESHDTHSAELSNHQLAMIGGGFADPTLG